MATNQHETTVLLKHDVAVGVAVIAIIGPSLGAARTNVVAAIRSV